MCKLALKCRNLGKSTSQISPLWNYKYFPLSLFATILSLSKFLALGYIYSPHHSLPALSPSHIVCHQNRFLKEKNRIKNLTLIVSRNKPHHQLQISTKIRPLTCIPVFFLQIFAGIGVTGRKRERRRTFCVLQLFVVCCAWWWGDGTEARDFVGIERRGGRRSGAEFGFRLDCRKMDRECELRRGGWRLRRANRGGAS